MRRLFICFVIAIGSTSWMGCSLSNHNVQQNPLLGSLRGKSRPATVDRQLALARLSERHGQPGKAEQIYQNVISKSPNEVVAHQRLAILAAKRGQFDAAMEHFENAKRAGQPSAQLLGDIGYAYYLQHKLPEAESHFREALQADPSDTRARTNLGLVLGEQGRFDESLVEFQQAGDEAAAFNNLAYVQSQVGHLREAEANYHKALKYDPNNRHAAEALIQVAAKTSTLDKSAPTQPRGVHATERALAVKPVAPQRENQAPLTNSPPVKQAIAQVSNAPRAANGQQRSPAVAQVASAATPQAPMQRKPAVAQVVKPPMVASPQREPAVAQVTKPAIQNAKPQREEAVVPRNYMSRPRQGVAATPTAQTGQGKLMPKGSPTTTGQQTVVNAERPTPKQSESQDRVQVAEVPAPLRIRANPFLQTSNASAAEKSPPANVKTIQIQMPTAVPIDRPEARSSVPSVPATPVTKPATAGESRQAPAAGTAEASLSDAQPAQLAPVVPQSSRIPASLTQQPLSNHVPPSLVLPRSVPITR